MSELTEYEKERDARIARNKAMLAALGLEAAADDVKSLAGGTKKVGSGPRRRSKRAATATAGSDEEGSSNGDMDSEEDEYRPTREDNASDEEKNDNPFDDSATDDQETPESRGKQVQRSRSRPRSCSRAMPSARSGAKSNLEALTSSQATLMADLVAAEGIEVDEDALALQQAMALSLMDYTSNGTGEAAGRSEPTPSSREARKSHSTTTTTPTRERKPKKRVRRGQEAVQLSEDEVHALFYQLFDERHTGSMYSRDVRRVAEAHDLMWEDAELEDMIALFTSSTTQKLNAGEFREVMSRCNVLSAPH